MDEGATACLRCELSQECASVDWRKGSLQLFPCAKYQMVQKGTTVELLVRSAEQEDAGHYTCDTGHTQSTASLSVRGELPSGPLSPAPRSPQSPAGSPEPCLAALSAAPWPPSLQTRVPGGAAEHGAGSRRCGLAALPAEQGRD